MKLSEFVQAEFVTPARQLRKNELAMRAGRHPHHLNPEIELQVKFEILLEALDESGFQVIDE